MALTSVLWQEVSVMGDFICCWIKTNQVEIRPRLYLLLGECEYLLVLELLFFLMHTKV